jgi:hypothetical protein
MNKLIYLSVAAAMAVTSSGAAFAADEAADADQKVVCKRDGTVGTRLARRVCMTRAQWKETETALRDKAKDSQRDYQRDNEARLANGGDNARSIAPN